MGKKKEKVYLKCQDCGKQDHTVKETYCPFAWEIDDVKVEIIVCEDCRVERGDDI